jgi:hypothetical protein
MLDVSISHPQFQLFSKNTAFFYTGRCLFWTSIQNQGKTKADIFGQKRTKICDQIKFRESCVSDQVTWSHLVTNTRFPNSNITGVRSSSYFFS